MVKIYFWGGWYGAKVQLLPTLSYQYNDYELGGHDSWYAASLRPVFPINQTFSVQTEVGYAKNNLIVDNVDRGSDSRKISIVPTFTVNTGTGPSPEIRFLTTYVHRNFNTPWQQKDSRNDFLVGIQADMWW